MHMGYLNTGIDLLGTKDLVQDSGMYLIADTSVKRNPHAKGLISESVVRMKPIAYLCETICNHWERWNEDLKFSNTNTARMESNT